MDVCFLVLVVKVVSQAVTGQKGEVVTGSYSQEAARGVSLSLAHSSRCICLTYICCITK